MPCAGNLVNYAGSVWADETLNHIIGHTAELEQKLEYIRRNPVRGVSRIMRIVMSGCFSRSITG